ncbi:fanconi-associated nuclease 1-like isoform X2 [Pieris napi]|uniref:fanconi-associated nuclease 1-like isoform X2 n=1 Tax=Pieris napi TaxID=78633 RepID=UPI001FBB90E4|nr:fanconi-associated nuclease 1-like isoform X2 [Pieris napi]
MKHQMKIDKFYPFKASKSLKFEKNDYYGNSNIKIEMETPKKRSNTSLQIPSPSKTPKLEEPDIITLSSDEEESPLSDTTVAYTPEAQSPITPSSSEGFLNTRTFNIKKDPYQDTTQYTGHIESIDDQAKSPTSTSRKTKKYFSPNKKRIITIRSPGKARKNLNKIISETDDNDLIEACSGYDDKTIFVIKIIHQCLNNQNLRSLLDEKSQKLLQNCMSVLKPGLHLVCKLYWRKEAWYRPEKIEDVFNKGNYSCNLKQILDNLIQNGLLQTNEANRANALNLNFYIDTLKVNEVKAICKEFNIKFKNKEAAKVSLEKFCNQKSIGHYFATTSQPNNQRVLESLRLKCGQCFKLTEHTRRTLDELYILMYLGIDWSILREKNVELMLFNIKSKSETYPAQDINLIDNASIVFKNRREFQSYIKASEIYEEFLNTSDTLIRRSIIEKVYKQYLEIRTEEMTSYMSLPVWLRKFTPPYLYIKILENGLPDLKKPLEKEKYCHLALEILRVMVSQDAFRSQKKPKWYAEMALIYDKCLNNADKSAEIVLEGFSKLDVRDYEKDCLRVRARMLTNRVTNKPVDNLVIALTGHALQEPVEKDIKATHINKQAMETFDKGKKKFHCRLPDSTIVMEAEEYCRRYYIEQGEYTHGEHWEGSIITTIFTLLFWDIIYAELRGVRGIFITPYQKYPLDLFTESFYWNRQCLIEDRLNNMEKLSVEDLITSMKKVWDTRPECELSDIQRKKMNWDKIEAVCSCLGNRSLAIICRRLALDYRYNHSGFPDLTMWNPLTKQITFVEVKTDSDKPSIKQIQWMRYLQCNNINTEFCYIGTNTTKSKARNVNN